MGLKYYRLDQASYPPLVLLIRAHEADMLGPRARGYWFEYPHDYEFEAVRAIAQELDKLAEKAAVEALELSEPEAHSLAQLEVEMLSDAQNFPPALFLCSLSSDGVKRQLSIARRTLGSTPERAAATFSASSRDPRLSGYLIKTLARLRIALPKVWRFYERAAEAGQAVVVVDLRARDLFVPDAVELAGIATEW